ncbi:MAG TPA: histidine phosphatase family protein [Rhodocyclaceae bacterium]|nr:histidine phosphatase family protein [Rhodocyclaceae bacterium]
MILHLVRHPRPVVPADTCYGRLDVAAEGVEAAAERLRALLPAGLPVWTSPLTRCRALAECLHPAPVVDGRLAEMDFGEWEGRTWQDIGPAALDAWAEDVAGFTFPGGESAWILQRRALACVAEIAVGEAVLVTHAGVLRMLLAHWLGLEPEAWLRLTFPYGTATTVDLAATGGTVLHLNR